MIYLKQNKNNKFNDLSSERKMYLENVYEND